MISGIFNFLIDFFNGSLSFKNELLQLLLQLLVQVLKFFLLLISSFILPVLFLNCLNETSVCSFLPGVHVAEGMVLITFYSVCHHFSLPFFIWDFWLFYYWLCGFLSLFFFFFSLERELNFLLVWLFSFHSQIEAVLLLFKTLSNHSIIVLFDI